MSGMLLYLRLTAMGLVALLVLAAAGWSSWDTARHIMFTDDRERGTIAVSGCGEETCTGLYDPEGPAAPRAGLRIDESVTVDKGDRIDVVVKPESDEVVRRGVGGVFYAWLPLGGALLLASFLIAGMGLTKVAMGSAIAGAAVIAGTFFTV
ncbi:hypothetical protein [Streptomyces clavuligerus]|uniref:Uncharacterized protein n=1 Tax=Streptomyces clavuligerus TaxID=1901 RepID=B5GPS0_STRCL|nr:hypothetical protein [Streptomyces clavuligerus]ANW19823.1 hypothetical protein BB341_17145 [Streptomyces clavuligerus]AXU14439.1 hypothetical protein D1794_17905 [Streptomyces clavuligerus]EDY48316.1 conserved hypothetical protein [Streptomyces clavuligerus]EFG07320.1 Hypothetical protein SCLAV_2247 [Streptomyces clavuligerus]MBY6304447.1 hypothetical protein [Streptomyces clavuligerus]